MKTHNLVFICSLIVVGLTTLPVHALPPGSDDELPSFTVPPIIVTASRYPLMDSELAGSTKIITAEDIAREQPADIATLLSTIPGLHVEQPGSRGSLGSIFMRGGEANFTLVMLDGVKVNDPTDARGGSFDFSTLDLNSIERIEIIYGPLSAIYGSDAVAGVINIITREGSEKKDIEAGIGAGMDGFFNGHCSIRGSSNTPIKYSLYAGYDDNGNPVEGDSYQGYSGGGKLGFAARSGSKIDAMFRYTSTDSESYPEDSGGQRYAVLSDLESRSTEDLIAGINYRQKLWPQAEFALIGTYFDRRFDSDSPGIAPGPRDPYGVPGNVISSDFHRGELTAQALVSISDLLKTAVGLAFQTEDAENQTVIFFGDEPTPGSFSLERRLLSPFLEVNLFPSELLTLQAGIRADFCDDYNTEANPKLGIVWQVVPSTATIKANWGRGFKLPSFFALGHPLVGNPDLLPERNESYDLKFSYFFEPNAFAASISLFHSEYEDLIDYEEGPPPRMVNRAEVTVTGCELDFTFALFATVSGEMYATYTETDDKNSPDQMLNRPEWQGGLKLPCDPTPSLKFTLNTRYVGDFSDSSVPTGRITIGDYYRVDTGCTWSPTEKYVLGLMVDNLFDADYEEAVGFTAPGLRLRASATVNL